MIFKTRKRGVSPESEMAIALAGMVDRTQATIRFTPDGTIVTANENFLTAMGYRLEEIVGKHHSLFVDTTYANSQEYQDFWADLRAGKVFTDQFPRRSKSGEVVWIQATYAPVADADGKVKQVIKIAADVTRRRRALEEIAKGLDALSNGDLTRRVKPSDIADIKILGETFNRSVSQLEQTLRNVAQVSQAVGGTAAEISQASHDMSQRTETQAGTLEETAAAMEELTATVRAAAEGARAVEESVRAAQSTAKKSEEVVDRGIDAMSKIEKSSSQISKIISVIDDIAFQTNLLALNAGVEAARAGDAGRGFAVVASEVRGLAQRCASAAGEIKGLIGESSQHVASGVSQVGKTRDELKAIIEIVDSISQHIAAIAKGAQEQSTSLGEINSSVTHLEQVTQRNAAMVEETTAATQTLSNDANQLMHEIASFRISSEFDAGATNMRSTPHQGRTATKQGIAMAG